MRLRMGPLSRSAAESAHLGLLVLGKGVEDLVCRGVALFEWRAHSIPILSNYLFEAAVDKLSLAPTDLDLRLRTSCVYSAIDGADLL